MSDHWTPRLVDPSKDYAARALEMVECAGFKLPSAYQIQAVAAFLASCDARRAEVEKAHP